MDSFKVSFVSEYTQVLVDYVSSFRRAINSGCVHLEPWQIIAYTLSTIFFTLWVNTWFHGDEPFFTVIKRRVFHYIRKIPVINQKIQKELNKIRLELQETIHKCDQAKEFFKFLPDQGMSTDDVLFEAEQYAQMGEFKYENGRVSGAVYTNQTKQHKEVLNKIFDLYAYSNPLHPDVFPGARKMEAEVVRMVCNLYHGGVHSCGTMTSGGTESILLACLAYRNRAYDHGNYAPEMVVPVTVHAAFDKAASYFRIRIRHVPVDRDTMQVDLRAMKKAITSRTCLLVGSAPNFPYGTIDPIEDIARLGHQYKIPVHVDACLGGFLLPFMEHCDIPVKPFDFRLPAVTSISCDTHKYGYAPKGSSLIMYRETKYLHYQYFCTSDWPGGIYATPTFAGSRPGMNAALTWATMLHFGKQGYMAATSQIIETTQFIRDGLAEIEGIRLVGLSDVSVVAFGSDAFNIFNLGDKMTQKGWNLNILQNPPCVHLCVTFNQTFEGVAEKFLSDVNEVAHQLLDMPPGAEQSKTAAIYGMAASVPDRTIVRDVAFAFLDCCYELPSSGRDSRKGSMVSKHSFSNAQRRLQHILTEGELNSAANINVKGQGTAPPKFM